MLYILDVGHISKSGERVEWSIPDFLSHSMDDDEVHLHSPVFSMYEMECELSFVIPRKQWSIYFRLILTNRHHQVAVTPVTYTYGLKTFYGKIAVLTRGTRNLSEKEDFYEFYPDFEITCTDLQTRKSKFLPSGILTLTCGLEIGDKSAPLDGEEEWTTHAPGVEESQRCKNPIDKTAEKDAEKTKNLTKLSDDFKDLLLNETDTDVVLKVSGKEFKVHRVIIRTRSPVLFAMFAHDTEERRTGVVHIEDCDPNTFPDFLRYVYTGQAEALTEQKALHLYRTADKYQLPELKEQCRELLKRSICIDNFCDVLALSLQHNERELTEIATQFFVDNALEIVLTPRWLKFLKENPTTANELFIKTFQKGR